MTKNMDRLFKVGDKVRNKITNKIGEIRPTFCGMSHYNVAYDDFVRFEESEVLKYLLEESKKERNGMVFFVGDVVRNKKNGDTGTAMPSGSTTKILIKYDHGPEEFLDVGDAELVQRYNHKPEVKTHLTEPTAPLKDKSDFEVAAEEVGKLVTEKNKAYGNSFEDAEHFLKILFPEGIKVENYSDMLCIVRIFDKLKRIATNKDAYNENPYKDLIGYGILGFVKEKKRGKT